MPKDFTFSLTDIYDRLTREGKYFDYPAIAAAMAERLRGCPLIAAHNNQIQLLELCIGTGSVAFELERLLGCSVHGIDLDAQMLARLESWKAQSKSAVTAELGSAVTFDTQGFDGAYIHSGHLIINAITTDSGLSYRLNVGPEGDPVTTVTSTLRSIARALQPGGMLLMNVEYWNDLKIELGDGSVYQRFVHEETPGYGSRVHAFYDAATRTIYPEIVVRQPKLSFDVFQRLLDGCGFDNIQIDGQFMTAIKR